MNEDWLLSVITDIFGITELLVLNLHDVSELGFFSPNVEGPELLAHTRLLEIKAHLYLWMGVLASEKCVNEQNVVYYVCKCTKL